MYTDNYNYLAERLELSPVPKKLAALILDNLNFFCKYDIQSVYQK